MREIDNVGEKTRERERGSKKKKKRKKKKHPREKISLFSKKKKMRTNCKSSPPHPFLNTFHFFLLPFFFSHPSAFQKERRNKKHQRTYTFYGAFFIRFFCEIEIICVRKKRERERKELPKFCCCFLSLVPSLSFSLPLRSLPSISFFFFSFETQDRFE